MKITLDLETNEITVPKNLFKKIEKENDIIKSHGGKPVTPIDRIKKAFKTATDNTDKYLHVKE